MFLKWSYAVCLFALCVLVSSEVASISNEISSKIIKNKQFKFYWNVPSFQCDSFKLNFSKVLEKYDITQNSNARFRGEEIIILYDPGDFPALLTTKENQLFHRNGGVPQRGNLTLHLNHFRNITEELIPNKNYSGLAIIDFESWRPIFRQNFGVLEAYKNYSINLEKQLYREWSKSWVEKEAQRRFEEYGKIFMEETLALAKKLRPNASWGYYAYPYCFNKSPSNMNKTCPKNVQSENDRILWLFNNSDSYYPSVYLNDLKLTAQDKIELIQGRIDEATRMNKQLKQNKKIFAYFWYKYHDTDQFLTKTDISNTLSALAKSKASGVVLWGSSNDVNNKQKCKNLYDYVDRILGPIIQSLLT